METEAKDNSMSEHCVRALIWLPVTLLPVANIILVSASGADYDLNRVLPLVISAAGEELFFRFFLLKTLLLKGSKLKPELSICIVAVLFAGMHLFNLRAGDPFMAVLMQMIFAFCFSIWAGAVLLRTDRIWIPLLAHVALNATSAADVVWTDAVWVDVIVGAVVLADGLILMRRENRI